MAYANTADYVFKIYDVGNTAGWLPVACTVANWEVSYEANDNAMPGIIPSSFSADFFGGMNLATWRSILVDSNNNFAIEIHKGLDVFWRGFIIPDQCTIEVVNGQRFIRIVASDGFQMFDRDSNTYKFDGVKAFTDQIAESLDSINFWNLYEGFVVSELFRPNSALTYVQGSLWWTGCLSEGVWWDGFKYNKVRDFFTDLCNAYGLQLFQDKGALVFKNVYDKEPAYYYYYNSLGNYVTRFAPIGTTFTPTVGTDGLELYKPALRELTIVHDAQNAQGIFYDDPQTVVRFNQFLGMATPSGSNHFDLYTDLAINLLLPPNYPSQKVDITTYGTARFNGYYWNGTNWTQTPSTFVLYNFSGIVSNPSATTAVHTFTASINNYHLGTFPSVPEDTFAWTVSSTQTLGTPPTSITSTSTLTLIYHGDAPAQTTYYADNTIRRNGVSEVLNTSLGDIFDVNPAVPKQIRAFATTARTSDSATGVWDNSSDPLLQLVAYNIARKNYQAHQYYEIDFTAPVWVNHIFSWGGDDYRPVNVKVNERNTRLTYKKYVDGNIYTAPETGR